MPKLPTKKKSNGAAPKATPPIAKSPKRDVLYETVSVELCIGDDAMTADHAKKLIGWVDENVTVPDCYDLEGKKVVLANNIGNRSFDKGLAMMWMSEILHRRWKVNGETLIIGRTGVTISAQHRCVGLIWAVQEWQRSKENWPAWTTEPTLPCIIVFGIDEDDATVNTVDTGKPRGLDDVIYRSDLFKGMEPKERSKASKAAKNAVNLLYHRTGADLDALVKGRRSHSDSLDFVARHPRLLKCVRHITEEDGNGKVGKYLTVGYAAAFMYLMGCSTSEPSNYRKTGIEPCEDFLKWELFDKAETFWTELAQGHKRFDALQTALSNLYASDDVYPATRQALIAKAWTCYSAGKPITESALELKFKIEDESKKLVGCPTVGGVDKGNPKIGEPDEDDADEHADPTPAEIEAAKASIKNEKLNGKAKKKGKQAAAKVGQQVWVAEDGGHFTGKLESTYEANGFTVAVIQMKNGKATEARLEECLTLDPNG